MIPEQIFERTLLSLLEPVAPYLADPSVSEIMINGPHNVFIERRGVLEKTPAKFESSERIMAALRNVAQYVGGFIDPQHPILEARLPDGSRLEAVIAPVASDGPSIAIRRFSKVKLTLPQLVQFGALTEHAAQALTALTHAQCNIVVAGGTGSGKTSLLNVLAGAVPSGERVLVLEDTREIDLDRDHVVYMTGRKPDEQGDGEITIRDLFRASLRMRPDRIIVGEIRGAEALDMVQATVSGHGGCMSTLHATYPRDTLTRLETMCMMSDLNMPLPAIRSQLASGIDVVVQVARLRDGSRGISHVTEVLGYDSAQQRFKLRDLFVRVYDGVDPQGKLLTRLLPTGIVPSFLDKLRAHGLDWQEDKHGERAQDTQNE